MVGYRLSDWQVTATRVLHAVGALGALATGHAEATVTNLGKQQVQGPSLMVLVCDTTCSTPIPNATVIVTSDSGRLIQDGLTNHDGVLWVSYARGSTLHIEARFPGFLPGSVAYRTDASKTD